MSCRLEPAIWSRDTGQQIPCFDRCQLIIRGMSNIKEVHGKPRLHDSVKLLFGEYGRHVARLHRRRCRRPKQLELDHAASLSTASVTANSLRTIKNIHVLKHVFTQSCQSLGIVSLRIQPPLTSRRVSHVVAGANERRLYSQVME